MYGILLKHSPPHSIDIQIKSGTKTKQNQTKPNGIEALNQRIFFILYTFNACNEDVRLNNEILNI